MEKTNAAQDLHKALQVWAKIERLWKQMNAQVCNPVRLALGVESPKPAWDSAREVWIQSLEVGDVVAVCSAIEDSMRGKWGTDVGRCVDIAVVSRVTSAQIRMISARALADHSDAHAVCSRNPLKDNFGSFTRYQTRTGKFELVRMRTPEELVRTHLNAFVRPGEGVSEEEFLHYIGACQGISVGARIDNGNFCVSIDSDERLKFLASLGITTADRVTPYGGELFDNLSKKEEL